MKKNNYKKSSYNWFMREADNDIKGLTPEQREIALKNAKKQWNLEKYYNHNSNFLKIKRAVIKYFQSLSEGVRDQELGDKLNSHPYIYTGLAWFESFAEI
jgi:arginine deiminase